MDISNVISFNNLEYIILDKTTLRNKDYLYCVQIDSNDLPLEEYKFFKSSIENNSYYVEEVIDKDLQKDLTAIFANNYLNEEQAG